jgi:two-component system chemotaxis response regulator CheY
MRVLIVDDSVVMRRMLTSFVEDLAGECVQACDGVEALEQLECQKPFDVALVDWDMPRMDGIEFVTRVRANPRWGGLKLLMVTANVAGAAVEKALTCGADDYLMKPVMPEMIAEKLRILGLVA